MIQAFLKVKGMTCNHCVETITNSLEKLSGVSEVIINLDEKEVKLDYDENSIKLNKIIGEISALGFEIAEE
tara:strand:- start:2805 stop:3017 length:213 start_codon:yes stop_codon:yes gene_type:complete